MLLARAGGLEGFARHSVIKRIRPELATEERFVTAFLEEARIAASLHHQNIVQVHDIGDEGGSFYFAMEYVHGEDLRKLINRVRERNEVVPLQHVMSIVMATAAGLHYAHEQVFPSGETKGIVHRDVSPANILVGYDGSVKLVDFGLAKAVQRSTNATASGTLKGKCSYMSPEQCTGKPLDRRTDTFSLGIVLFELLTAHRLFKGINEFMTMAAIVDGEIPRPSTFRKDVPPALDEIIMRALSRAPASRYQTAESLRESLEAFSVSAELRTSAKALADYLVTLFGERMEPWLDQNPSVQSWVEVEATHSGVVAKPRDQHELLSRFAVSSEAPIALAQTEDQEWGLEEHELTAGQRPSLRRQGGNLPTEPTQTLRPAGSTQAATVNANVRPRPSEPRPSEPAPAPPRASEPPQSVSPNVRPRGDAAASGARNVLEPQPTRSRGSEPPLSVNANVRPRQSDPAIALPSRNQYDDAPLVGMNDKLDDSTLVGGDTTATGQVAADVTSTKQTAARVDDEIPGSSTMVEPPIFDGTVGPVGRDDDDDGLDDEPATELSVNVPEPPPPPPVEKVPMALRRPMRSAAANELPRMNEPPAPLRPGPRTALSQSQAMHVPPQAREITPPGSPPAPAQPFAYGHAPQQFPGIDPAQLAAGFNQPPRQDLDGMYQEAPPAPENLSVRLTGFAANGKTLLFVGIGIAIFLGGVLGMRGCSDDERPAAATDVDAAVDSADASDAGTREPAKSGSAAESGAASGSDPDAGSGSETTKKGVPVRKPPLKRPKTNK